MGRILAIDYGQKRVGIAVTDENRLIANALTTIPSAEVITFLQNYIAKENVDLLVVGEPKQVNNKASESTKFINPFLKQLQKTFPDIPIERMDERFTSKMAFQTMIDAGLGKKARQNKALVDAISATIILQSYLESLAFKNTQEK
ncbi:MAG: Holliday junction resolvase RuvX [Bacteroidales bacterium]|nr:Holliday junction resolvase RuvX [Bacteroidales bacterium]